MRGKGSLEAGGVGPRGLWGPQQGTEADFKSQRQQRKDFKLGLYLRSLLRLALARRTRSLCHSGSRQSREKVSWSLEEEKMLVWMS